MTAAQALAKARKLLGPKALVRFDAKAPAGLEREINLANLKATAIEVKAAEEAMNARRAEVLRADAEYQRLKLEHAALVKRRDSIPSWHQRRVTIGTDGGFFFSVKAEGDNYAEAVAALTTEEAA